METVGLPTVTPHGNAHFPLVKLSHHPTIFPTTFLLFPSANIDSRQLGITGHCFCQPQLLVQERLNLYHRFMEKIFEDRFPTSPFQASSLDRSSSLSEPVSPSQSPSSSNHSTPFTENGELVADGRNHKMKKLDRKGTSFAYRVREHVKMGPKFSETVKGKLSVGAKIIKKGGRENIFRDIFGVSDGEKLLKASQCYLSTTAGPIAGILFISTHKISFCSERSITVHSSLGGLTRIPYKVSIPVEKIKAANESENVNNPSQKYIEIVTDDNFEFWFMGFVRYEKAVVNLQRAISMSR